MLYCIVLIGVFNMLSAMNNKNKDIDRVFINIIQVFNNQMHDCKIKSYKRVPIIINKSRYK